MVQNKNYSPIALGETKDLSNDEWLKWREHGPDYNNPLSPRYIACTVGGSAVSIIFGDNPWMSKLELFHQKSGIVTPKYQRKMNQEILDAGHEYEEYVARLFVRKMAAEGISNVEVWNDTIMYQHPYYPFAVCNLDRMIKVNGNTGILECKTTSNYDDIALWKKGIVPKKYEWQCRYYMATKNLNFCYICCAWGFTLDACAVILITRDLDIEEHMMEEIQTFVECCETGTEPDQQKSGHLKTLNEYYLRVYGEIDPKAPPIELPDTAEVYDLITRVSTLAERRDKVNAMTNALDEEEYEITSNLMKIMGGKSTYASYRMDEENVYSVKLNIPMKRATFDTERFMNEEPAMYQKYIKQELDVTKLKKEEKLLANKYVIPGVINAEKPITVDKVDVRKIPIQAAV